MAFIQLTSPLILAGDPTLPNHPATKQYVDAKANNINAAGFTAGTLNVLRLPELTGDVTMIAGSGNLVLSSTGVAPGTYPKVTLNAQGRVTAGSALAAADMPNMSWNKITSGLPTSLAGYGISNVIGLTGGVITGMLSSTATPTNALHLVTKQYVDANIQASGDSLATGDVVRKGYTTTPSGFLRCNGSKVNRTTYAALYAVLGDRYEILLTNGVELPFAHMQPLGLNGVQSGAMAAQAAASSGMGTVLTAYATHNRLFVLSSVNLGGYRYARSHYATINADGSLTNFTNDTANSAIGAGNSVNVVDENSYVEVAYSNNKIYMVVSPYFAAGAIYRASINSDGSHSVPTLLTNGGGTNRSTVPIVIKNRLYLIDADYAGTSGAIEVIYSTIASNGDLSAFTTLGTINANAVKKNLLDVFVYKNKLIVIAGPDGANYTAYYAAINSDGSLGAWSAGPSISGLTGLRKSRAVTTANEIFFMCTVGTQYFTYGDGEGAYNVLQSALRKLSLGVDAAGVPISWTLTGVLGPSEQGSIGRTAVAVPNRIYLTYGASAANYTAFSGGLQSYKQYYDGSYTVSDPVNFYIPDFTAKETFNTRYFVKT